MTKQKTAKEMYAKLIERLEHLIKKEEKAIQEFKNSIAECKSLEYTIKWKWQSVCISEYMMNEHKRTLRWVKSVIRQEEEKDEYEPRTPESLIEDRVEEIDDWFSHEGFRANSTCPQSNLHNQFQGQALVKVKEIYKRFG